MIGVTLEHDSDLFIYFYIWGMVALRFCIYEWIWIIFHLPTTIIDLDDLVKKKQN